MRDEQKKIEDEIAALHKATLEFLAVLGTDNYTDQQYADALEAVVSARAETVRATAADDELSPGQKAQLRSDVLNQFTIEELKRRGIQPTEASAEQYIDAFGTAEQVLEDKNAGI